MERKNDEREDRARTVHDGTRSRGRIPYVAPKIVDYGTVAKLTQAGGATATEPSSGLPQKMKCL